MGHARSETFQKHYLSSHVVIDVQATFLGNESKSDLIKEMGKMTLRRDPNLPTKLSEEEKQAAHQTPEINAAVDLFASTRRAVIKKFGRLNAAPPKDPLIKAFRNAQKVFNTLKARSERSAFRKRLQDFHSSADLECMTAQLSGKIPVSHPMLVKPEHAILQRNQLVEDLFKPADDATFARIVQNMSILCVSIEPLKNRGSKSLPATVPHLTKPMQRVVKEQQDEMSASVSSSSNFLNTKSLSSNSYVLRSSKQKSTPMKIEKSRSSLTCLFCVNKKGMQYTFSRQDSLRKHYRKHFKDQLDPFICPVANCGAVISNSNEFSGHAVEMHGIDLGLRGSIMHSKAQSIKWEKPIELVHTGL